MEKVLYSLAAAGTSPEDLGRRLLREVGPALVAAGASAVQLNVVDEVVAAAAPRRIATSARPADAVVSVWLASSGSAGRRAVDEVLAGTDASVEAHLVTESVPLHDPPAPAGDGGRTPGFSQIAFLRRPGSVSRDEWLSRWLDEHTQVAIATQSTFIYVQHVVTRALTPGATPWDGIVEECFPEAAMADDEVFFGAVGDHRLMRSNQRAMFDSCARFLDFAQIDVLPTSRYVLSRLPTAETTGRPT